MKDNRLWVGRERFVNDVEALNRAVVLAMASQQPVDIEIEKGGRREVVCTVDFATGTRAFTALCRKIGLPFGQR